MSIIGIILFIYWIIGLTLGSIALIKAEKVWGNGSFGGMGFIYVGCMLLWPIIYPSIMKEIKETQNNK